MGWVVPGVVDRLRAERGLYGVSEWERFLAEHGLYCSFEEMPVEVPALVAGNAILVQDGLPDDVTALLVWHEAGHIVLHAGNREFWISRPLGRSTIRKMERQAWEFAYLFPDWSESEG